MEEKKYHIDNEPASAREIISKAKTLDDDFARSGFYQTSVAARILRENGYEVGELSEVK